MDLHFHTSRNVLINLLNNPFKIHYLKNNSVEYSYHELRSKPMTSSFKCVIQIMTRGNTWALLIEKNKVV